MFADKERSLCMRERVCVREKKKKKKKKKKTDRPEHIQTFACRKSPRSWLSKGKERVAVSNVEERQNKKAKKLKITQLP